MAARKRKRKTKKRKTATTYKGNKKVTSVIVLKNGSMKTLSGKRLTWGENFQNRKILSSKIGDK